MVRTSKQKGEGNMNTEMKEEYEGLEIEVIEFDSEDVITTSGNPDGNGQWT